MTQRSPPIRPPPPAQKKGESQPYWLRWGKVEWSELDTNVDAHILITGHFEKGRREERIRGEKEKTT